LDRPDLQTKKKIVLEAGGVFCFPGRARHAAGGLPGAFPVIIASVNSAGEIQNPNS
jgi:hypothetical protein